MGRSTRPVAPPSCIKGCFMQRGARIGALFLFSPVELIEEGLA